MTSATTAVVWASSALSKRMSPNPSSPTSMPRPRVASSAGARTLSANGGGDGTDQQQQGHDEQRRVDGQVATHREATLAVAPVALAGAINPGSW